jgi:ribose transport system ATP-binding protein
MSDKLLGIDSLSTFSGNTVNLNKVNFSLASSEVHALIGERGAGKYLFVNVLLGAEKEFTGKITFLDKDITYKASGMSKTKINFLIKEPMLAEGLKVYENFFLIKDNNKNFFQPINHLRLKKKVKEVFDHLNIFIDIKSFIHELTAEEKKVLEIAKLYYYKPDVVVMLEPTENLTKSSRDIFFDLVKMLKKRGTGIIYVTNKWEEALQIADKISIIYEGEIVGHLSASEAKKNPVRLIQFMSGLKINREVDKELDLIQKENEDVIDAIFTATEYLTSNYELNDVLKMLCKYSCKIMNSESCNIYLVDEHTHTVMDYISYSKTDSAISQIKTKVIMEVMKNNTYYYKNSNEDDFQSLFKKNKSKKSILCYPVQIRSNKTALIEVAYDTIFKYTEKQLRYLKTLSKQAAIAIDNTRLLGKSALLQETHHRIKNNLQTITSIIRMQKNNYEKIGRQNVDGLIDDIISRIKSIAVIHDLLSQDPEGRSIVNVKKLINALLEFYVIDGKPKVVLCIQDIFIPYNKTTSISLILNELLNNCIKHAFKKIEEGVIYISCQEKKDVIHISIKDNGKGLPDNFNIDELKSLGLFLVNSIVINDFSGRFNIYQESGTTATIEIPKEKLLLSKA